MARINAGALTEAAIAAHRVNLVRQRDPAVIKAAKLAGAGLLPRPAVRPQNSSKRCTSPGATPPSETRAARNHGALSGIRARRFRMPTVVKPVVKTAPPTHAQQKPETSWSRVFRTKGTRTPDPHTASVVRYQLCAMAPVCHRSYTTARHASKPLATGIPGGSAPARLRATPDGQVRHRQAGVAQRRAQRVSGQLSGRLRAQRPGGRVLQRLAVPGLGANIQPTAATTRISPLSPERPPERDVLGDLPDTQRPDDRPQVRHHLERRDRRAAAPLLPMMSATAACCGG